MAQLPPQLIHVKRKRTEDVPTEFMRIEQVSNHVSEQLNKRHRPNTSDVGTFLYRRTVVAKTDVEAGGSSTTNTVQANAYVNNSERPIIHTSKPGDERRRLASAKTRAKKATAAPAPSPHSHASTTISAPAPALTKIPPTAPEEESSLRKFPPAIPREPKRFYLSRRPSMPPESISTFSNLRVNKRARARNDSISAVFVERSQSPISKKKRMEKLVDKAVAADIETPQQEGDAMAVDTKPAMTAMPKRPGTKRIVTPAGQPPKLPDSMMDRWDVDTEQLALDMHEYSMQQIGLKLAEMEKTRIPQQPDKYPAHHRGTTTSVKDKFKPNFNVKRYHERHPEAAAALAPTPAKDVEMSDDTPESEDEYVTETYERVLSDTIAVADVPRDQMGLLVLEGEPDVEFFYGEEESESDHEYEDDEDENAEDYYAADYPDDEVASDDEFDRDPYSFRNGNTSDHEEFDGAYSDDDEDDKPSWMPRFDSTRFGSGPVFSGGYER